MVERLHPNKVHRLTSTYRFTLSRWIVVQNWGVVWGQTVLTHWTALQSNHLKVTLCSSLYVYRILLNKETPRIWNFIWPCIKQNDRIMQVSTCIGAPIYNAPTHSNTWLLHVNCCFPWPIQFGRGKVCAMCESMWYFRCACFGRG